MFGCPFAELMNDDLLQSPEMEGKGLVGGILTPIKRVTLADRFQSPGWWLSREVTTNENDCLCSPSPPLIGFRHHNTPTKLVSRLPNQVGVEGTKQHTAFPVLVGESLLRSATNPAEKTGAASLPGLRTNTHTHPTTIQRETTA